MGKTKKEIARFIVSGICAVTTDMLFYYLLSNFLEISLAKGISFLIGTITAYLMNKYYTFEQKDKSAKEVIQFVSLYLVSLLVNIGINKISLILLPLPLQYLPSLTNYQTVKLLAFLLATGASTVLNFLGQKFWVFNHNKGDNK